MSEGEPAIVAKKEMVVLSTVNKAFIDVDTVYTQLGCDDCPTYLKAPDHVLLGTSLKNQYRNYDCVSGDKCTGACISSAQVCKSSNCFPLSVHIVFSVKCNPSMVDASI